MKATMLKIAGVKSEAAFYKKFPNQEAFMKVHGKEFKKAQVGMAIGGGANKQFVPQAQSTINFQDYYDKADMSNTGSTDAQRQKSAYDQSMLAAQTNKGGSSSGGGGLGGMMSGLTDMASMFGEGGEAAAARYGSNIYKAQGGFNFPPPIDASLEGSPGYQQQQANSQGPQQSPQAQAQTQGGSGFSKAAKTFGGPIGELAEGYDMLRQERTARKQAEQNKAISDVTRKASATREEQPERKYVRPEDIQNTGEEFFPIYGVGTNPLARNGGRFQGGGEIQNTYAPNDIYNDLGYEPLNDSNQQKTFRHGGDIYRAANGFSNWQNTMSGGGSGFSGAGEAAEGGTPWGAISSKATGVGQSLTGGQNAGGKIGGTVGGAIGSAFGPGGKALGEFVGGMAGNFLDKNAKKTKTFDEGTKNNTTATAFNSGMQGLQGQRNANVQNGGELSMYEDGGWVSNDWTPQVIASFGDHSAKDVYDFAHEGMDTLRAGGHLQSYTPPSERAMESYSMGGQLQTHWGGEAETVSHNPYLPGSGETVAFRGQSHTESDGNGKTGIGITYGDNPVEVERGEPMFEMQSGGQVNPETGEPENTGVVFGNMEVNKNIAGQFNDPELMAIADKYHGKKFKNIGLELSKNEAKQNKIVNKNTDLLTSLKVTTPFDKLKMSSYKANLEGADQTLKELANTKIMLANYQNAINDTKEEISNGVGKNISAEHLAKGLIQLDKDPVTRNAKWGSDIKKAQVGIGNIQGGELNEVVIQGKKKNKREQIVPLERMQSKGLVYDLKPKADLPTSEQLLRSRVNPTEEKDDTKFPWEQYANQAIKYLRPSDQEGLDYEQLYPEWSAMASNQLEPVPMQFYQPELNVPYDINLQAQRNAIISRDRALQRQLGYNPSAQANAAPNAYNAINEINQAEFQANQAAKNQMYAANRATMNQAQMTNLGAAADQWGKQALARSNTKATTQAALSSIADKYAKNKLENRTLGIYENMYNYRFGKDSKADNWNPLQSFDIAMGGAKSKGSGVPEGWKASNYDAYGNPTSMKRIGEDANAKNGGAVKKNQKNSSVVRAYKNL